MTRFKPDADKTRRTARRAHLERLNALEAPTASEQTLRRHLTRIEAADPEEDDNGELRRVLGLQ